MEANRRLSGPGATLDDEQLLQRGPDDEVLLGRDRVANNECTARRDLRTRQLESTLPADASEGINDWKQVGYRGPCPPVGHHHYFFKLYALDTDLPEVDRATKRQIENAMKGHILAEAQLIGLYQH